MFVYGLVIPCVRPSTTLAIFCISPLKPIFALKIGQPTWRNPGCAMIYVEQDALMLFYETCRSVLQVHELISEQGEEKRDYDHKLIPDCYLAIVVGDRGLRTKYS